MKKILNFIKKHILFTILLILFILIIILGIVAVKVIIFPSYSETNYGDRLDGISDVEITDEHVNEIKSSMENIEGINYLNYRLSGKIINIYLSVDDNIKNEDVKNYANEFISKFSEKEIAFYDFQVFIKKNDECYLIGYKNKKSTELIWNYEGEV